MLSLRIERYDVVGSTNDVAVAAAGERQPEGLVVVADEQRAGRGRLGRGWESPKGAGLYVSVLLRPPVPPPAWPLLGLLCGVAAVAALRRAGGVEGALKWPNDVLVDGRKIAGILAEVTGDAVVVGMGLNVLQTRDQLPRPDATSILLAGGRVDREALLTAWLDELARGYDQWCGSGGAPEAVLPAYRPLCRTISQAVRAELPTGETLAGTAHGVDDAGRLVVVDAAGAEHRLSAGDVRHLRG